MEITIRVPSIAELAATCKWGLLTALVLAFVLVGGASPVAAIGNSISSPDTAAAAEDTSAALDLAGNPVIAYYDQITHALKILHCNDASCTGGDESITMPAVGVTAYFVSLKLDASGNPVVGYWNNYDGNNPGLNILHCDDQNCAGGDESTTNPDVGANPYSISLQLEASVNPVVSYFDSTTSRLKVMHCNDANCSGGDESIVTAAPDGSYYSSLALDASGNPVVSYSGASGSGLKILHCDDANCSGGDESITTADSSLGAGQSPSLALDAFGYPVVSYQAGNSTDLHLKILHCNDADCAGGDDSTTVADANRNVGSFASLALDASGNPVVSYWKEPNFDSPEAALKVLHCNDANCAGGDESITIPDVDLGLGAPFTSLALAATGKPVIAYNGGSDSNDLRLLHCSDAYCAGLKGPPQIDITNLGQYALPKACFAIRNAAQSPLFVVCDNNFQGPPATNAACVPDGICQDEDPAGGSVRVTVADGAYYVQEKSQAPNHSLDLAKRACSTAGKPNCDVTFIETPNTRPWFPWDLVGTSGPTGPVDGKVTVADIIAVIQHYARQKPLP